MELTHLMTVPSAKASTIPPLAERLIEQKHAEYARLCRNYRALYYGTRLIAGLCAGLLPFFVHSFPTVSTILSVAIVLMTVVDFIFNPKDRWKLFSRAADLLTIARLRAVGEYDKCADILDLLVATENAKLEQLVNIDDLVAKARKA